jgi:hypothetical protein
MICEYASGSLGRRGAAHRVESSRIGALVEVDTGWEGYNANGSVGMIQMAWLDGLVAALLGCACCRVFGAVAVSCAAVQGLV